MILLLSSMALADFCPESHTAEFISWARPMLFEWGDWTTQNGTIQLQTPEANGKWNVWIPRQDIAVDARYSLRLSVGTTPKTTVLARVALESEGRDEISGYGLSVEGNQLILYRWDKGERRPLMPPASFEHQGVIDLRFELHGDSLTGYVCSSQNNALLAKVHAMDSGHSSGLWGLMQDPKQGMDTTPIQLQIDRIHRSPIIDGFDIFGTEVLVQVAHNAPLPDDIKPFDLDRPPYPGQWVLLPNRSYIDLLTSADIQIQYATGRIPYWARNVAYRMASPEPEINADNTGFVLDKTYKDPRMVADLLKAYHSRYPEVTALHTLGNSRQGRPIWALRITDNPQKDEMEPAVLLVAAHHGSELLSTEYALDSIDELLRGAHGTDPKWITELDIWVVPLANPDGNACLWALDENHGRKNCWDMNGDGQIEATEGVDLNRNYPVQWGALGEKGSRSWPHAYTYRGPKAGSESETQTIMTWAQSYQPAVVLSWHTMANMILSPYTVDGLLPLEPDVPWFIAQQLLEGIPAPIGRETPPRLRRKLYSVDGVDQDWHLFNHGAMAYIVEGSHHNPLDMTIRNASVALYRPIRNRILEHLSAGPAIRIQVVDGSGQPIRASVQLEGLTLSNGELWQTRQHDGRWDFLVPEHKNYSLRIKAEGYRHKTVEVDTQALTKIVLNP